MTTAEQTLADDKMRAKIARMFGEISKMTAETAKLNAETAKIARERFWIPFTIFAGVLVAVLTVLPRLLGL